MSAPPLAGQCFTPFLFQVCFLLADLEHPLTLSPSPLSLGFIVLMLSSYLSFHFHPVCPLSYSLTPPPSPGDGASPLRIYFLQNLLGFPLPSVWFVRACTIVSSVQILFLVICSRIFLFIINIVSYLVSRCLDNPHTVDVLSSKSVLVLVSSLRAVALLPF